MATFILTATRNINFGMDSTGKIKQNDSRTINIAIDKVTTTNLFAPKNRALLASQLNIAWGTNFFNKDNIQTVSTSFKIKKL